MKDIDQHMSSIIIEDVTIEASSSAKNLGVIFHKSMNMDAHMHINATFRRAFLEIRNIGRIRSFLDEKAHSFVSSKIDYCNSLLYALPKKQLD